LDRSTWSKWIAELEKYDQPECDSSLDRFLTLGNSESRAPLVSKDVQANATVGVDIRVIDARGEVDLRGLERVVCWEVDGQEEDAA
jgi:hypothetical protein